MLRGGLFLFGIRPYFKFLRLRRKIPAAKDANAAAGPPWPAGGRMEGGGLYFFDVF